MDSLELAVLWQKAVLRGNRRIGVFGYSGPRLYKGRTLKYRSSRKQNMLSIFYPSSTPVLLPLMPQRRQKLASTVRSLEFSKC